jgi:hypothetical protein
MDPDSDPRGPKKNVDPDPDPQHWYVLQYVKEDDNLRMFRILWSKKPDRSVRPHESNKSVQKRYLKIMKQPQNCGITAFMLTAEQQEVTVTYGKE